MQAVGSERSKIKKRNRENLVNKTALKKPHAQTKKSEVRDAAPPRRQTCTACVFGVQDTVAVRLRRGGAADGERGLNTPADSPSSRVSRSKHRLGGSVASGGWGCAGGREWANPPTPRGRPWEADTWGERGGSGERGVRGARRGMRGGAPPLPANRDSNSPRRGRAQTPPTGRAANLGGAKPARWAETRLAFLARNSARDAPRGCTFRSVRGTRSMRGNTRAVRGRDLEGRRLVCRKEVAFLMARRAKR